MTSEETAASMSEPGEAIDVHPPKASVRKSMESVAGEGTRELFVASATVTVTPRDLELTPSTSMAEMKAPMMTPSPSADEDVEMGQDTSSLGETTVETEQVSPQLSTTRQAAASGNAEESELEESEDSGHYINGLDGSTDPPVSRGRGRPKKQSLQPTSRPASRQALPTQSAPLNPPISTDSQLQADAAGDIPSPVPSTQPITTSRVAAEASAKSGRGRKRKSPEDESSTTSVNGNSLKEPEEPPNKRTKRDDSPQLADTSRTDSKNGQDPSPDSSKSAVQAAEEPERDAPIEAVPFHCLALVSKSKGKTKKAAKLPKVNEAARECGKSPFKDELTIPYKVNPPSKWHILKCFKKFEIEDTQTGELLKLGEGDVVYVKKPAGEPQGQIRDWVAYIIEVRASSEHHVYARVFWLYRPEDLPSGRGPYHGRYEVIASNHMDIIDVNTVQGPVSEGADVSDVLHWDDGDDSKPCPEEGQLFWRQTYDSVTKNISVLRKICVCETPHNPDQPIIQCPNNACRIWLHAACIEDAAVDAAVKEAEDSGNSEISAVVHLRDADDPQSRTGITIHGDAGVVEKDLRCLSCKIRIE